MDRSESPLASLQQTSSSPRAANSLLAPATSHTSCALIFGLIVTIAETRPGRRGTLVHLRDEDGPMYYEDTGEHILDETHDGYSVYHAEAWQNGRKQGRCIFPDAEFLQEWEIVLFPGTKD
jgi:hypothetical protein